MYPGVVLTAVMAETGAIFLSEGLDATIR